MYWNQPEPDEVYQQSLELYEKILQSIEDCPVVRQHEYEIADMVPGRIFERNFGEGVHVFEIIDWPFKDDRGEWKVKVESFSS